MVDIENVIGGAAQRARDVRWAKKQICARVDPGEEDQVVIGTSHIGLMATSCTWPNVRYVVRSGPDGADRALCDVLTEDVAQRFSEVVIISGDHVFADPAETLTAQGLPVTVVAHTSSLSRRLADAATSVVGIARRSTSANPRRPRGGAASGAGRRPSRGAA